MENKKYEWCCKYCNDKFSSRRKLLTHYKKCLEKEKFPKDSLGRIIPEYDRKAAAEKRKITKEKNGTLHVGHKVSEETRKKLSEAAKKNLYGNYAWPRSKHKVSYAEQYFEDVLNDTNYVREYVIGKYRVDFAWLDKKIYFEVDGEQHYTNEGILYDKNREEILSKKGWVLLDRCRWSLFNKLEYNDRANYINALKKGISNSASVGKEDKLLSKSSGVKTVRVQDPFGRQKCKISASELEKRKELILNSGVDLSKFGWVKKVSEVTFLTKKQIEYVVKMFNLEVFCRKSTN